MPNSSIELIDGKARTVRELLMGRRYRLDFYQREYEWGDKEFGELLDDLTARFRAFYSDDHQRVDVRNYGPYFLGPMVVSTAETLRYLIDGQQRLTSLTLLLIFLRRLLEHDDREELQQLIYSRQYGEYSFNLDVDERAEALTALLEGREPNLEGADASVQNIVKRFQDIDRLFPSDLRDRELPFFKDWLLDKVVLVEISTTDADMAYAIFETMNDRGLRLTPVEMLKGFLLSRLGSHEAVEQCNVLWRTRIDELNALTGGADADFFKAWLRAKHAETIRERVRGASPRDFDLIGTQFHKWVRENHPRMGLESPSDYRRFLDHDFERMSHHYALLVQASVSMTPGLEHVFFNAATQSTLQYPMALASVVPTDSDETAIQKMNLVAAFLDLLVARRIVAFRNFGYNTLQYTMFNVILRIRGMDVPELATALLKEIAGIDEGFERAQSFSLNQRNGSHARYLLARMTDWLERQLSTEEGAGFAAYMSRNLPDPYEVEHIWANRFDRHRAEFQSELDFDQRRNQFGDLLLLPKSFNSSYRDIPYEEKLPRYLGQNVLVKTLHPDFYVNNPRFHQVIDSTGLEFKPYPDGFTSESIRERQVLYGEVAEHVWSKAIFENAARE